MPAQNAVPMQLIVWVVVLLAVLLAGAVGILLIRRSMFARDEKGGADQGLMDGLRGMRERGEISPEEFESMRRAMIAKLRDGGGPAAAEPVRRTPASPTTRTERQPTLEASTARTARPSASGAATPPSAIARPGFDLTGRPLPRARLTNWQYAGIAAGAAPAVLLLADLLYSIASGSRGLLWVAPGFMAMQGVASSFPMVAAMVIACLCALLAAGNAVVTAGTGDQRLGILLPGAAATFLPVLGHWAAQMQAGPRATEVIRAVTLPRGLTESLTAGTIIALGVVVIWASRRRA